MKIEQAIEIIERKCSIPYGNESFESDIEPAYDAAVNALIEKSEREKTQTLTLKELKQMHGKPVWWWNKSHKPVCTLCTLNKFDIESPMFVCFDYPFAKDECTGLVKYEKLIKHGWRPYEYEPKED